jgi:phosphotriesterase-related protein
MTVLGPLPAEELGTTITHEHLLIDFRCRFTGSAASGDIGPHLDLRDRWRLVQEPAAFEANLLRNDVGEAIVEVDAYLEAGGRTIVDATTEGLGPNTAGLVRVSEATGANIIASTGIYAHVSHASWVHEATVERLAHFMLDAIHVPDQAGVRRGFIGEIGVDGPTDCEMNVVRAAAIAQRETGVPVSIHLLSGALPDKRADALAVVETFVAAGGDPHRLIACHQDGSGDDPEYQEQLLRQGITLEYDTFGFESVFAHKGGFVQLPTDSRRIDEVADLWERGWGEQVVLSQDVCYRMMTREWGGWGIAHILQALPRRFASAGIGEAELDTMMVRTPRRLLAFLP